MIALTNDERADQEAYPLPRNGLLADRRIIGILYGFIFIGLLGFSTEQSRDLCPDSEQKDAAHSQPRQDDLNHHTSKSRIQVHSNTSKK